MTTQATITLQVLYFHTLREAAGVDGESLAVPAGSSVQDCVDLLCGRHARLAPHAGSMLVAVNEEWTPRTSTVAGGDTLALMPPVSGG